EADADYREIEEQKAAQEQRVAELQTDKKNLRALREKFSTQNAKVSELENDKAGLADQVQQAASAYGIAKAVFEQGLLAIPEEVRVLSVLKEKITEAEAEKGNLERLWEKIQQELQRTKEQYTEASVSAKHAAATAK